MSTTAANAAPLPDAQERWDLDALRDQCSDVLVRAGLAVESANLVADSLVDAEARGIASHGVARTRIYAERLRAGLLDASASPTVIKESVGGVFIDAHNAIGHVGALAGIEAAIDRATNGAAVVVGVSNSNHCGALAYFARMATAKGLAVIAMSTAPPTMAYFGGRTPAVGTNPLCLAVPRMGRAPIVLDMATSATARGKIILAEKLQKQIPEGWAVDKDGRPTVDAAAALQGAVLPFAGPKGSGLAMMIDLLCGGMIAGVSGWDIGNMYEDWSRIQRVSHLFIVMNPNAWLSSELFATYTEQFAEQVHGLPPAEGFNGVILPGELEEAALGRARREGVFLSRTVAADLELLTKEFGAGIEREK